MKNLLATLLLGTTLATSALADTFTFTMVTNQVVPDANANGLTTIQNIQGLPDLVRNISVSLSLSGGWNGDLYAFLRHETIENNVVVSEMAVLLNRVGLSTANPDGYRNAGFQVTLDDHAANNIHFYQNFNPTFNGGSLTGIWHPDGFALDPGSPAAAFDLASPVPAPLSAFNMHDPNGEWSLFVADLSGGGESTLLGWSLIVDVPEPSVISLALCGLAVFVLRRRKAV